MSGFIDGLLERGGTALKSGGLGGLIGAALGFMIPIPGTTELGATLGAAIGGGAGFLAPDTVNGAIDGWWEGGKTGAKWGAIIGAIIGFFTGGIGGAVAGAILGGVAGGTVGGGLGGMLGAVKGLFSSDTDKTAPERTLTPELARARAQLQDMGYDVSPIATPGMQKQGQAKGS